MFLAVRAVGDPVALANAVRNAVREMDPDQPISSIRTMEQRVDNSVTQPRFNTLLLAMFAVVALILASIGIYGVMNYAVTQRTHEIGVRMALGARQGDIIKLVVGQGLLMVIAGVMARIGRSLRTHARHGDLCFSVSAPPIR